MDTRGLVVSGLTERAETLGEVRQRDVRASSARPRLEGDLLETPREIYQRVDRSLREATDETSKGRFVDAVPHGTRASRHTSTVLPRNVQ